MLLNNQSPILPLHIFNGGSPDSGPGCCCIFRQNMQVYHEMCSCRKNYSIRNRTVKIQKRQRTNPLPLFVFFLSNVNVQYLSITCLLHVIFSLSHIAKILDYTGFIRIFQREQLPLLLLLQIQSYQPLGCFLHRSVPSSQREQVQKKILQTEHRCAYVP